MQLYALPFFQQHNCQFQKRSTQERSQKTIFMQKKSSDKKYVGGCGCGGLVTVLCHGEPSKTHVQMSQVSPAFHTEATVSIGLKNILGV